MDLPSHPEADDQEPAKPSSDWGVRLVFAAVAAVIVLIVILHLTGVVGPAAN